MSGRREESRILDYICCGGGVINYLVCLKGRSQYQALSNRAEKWTFRNWNVKPEHRESEYVHHLCPMSALLARITSHDISICLEHPQCCMQDFGFHHRSRGVVGRRRRRSPAVRRSREAAAALLKLELEGDTVLMYDRTYL